MKYTMRLIIFSYFGCIHVLLLIVLLKTDFIPRVGHKLGITINQSEISDFYNRLLIYHTKIDKSVPPGAIVFIGDSIMQGICVSAIASPSVNYSISGDTTYGVLKRLAVYSSIENASAVVIAIGVNDMEFRSNTEILRNYSAMSKLIPKKVPVIFSAVLPIDENVLDKRLRRNQNRIKKLNSQLQKLVAKSENRFFVDVGPLLIDTKGDLADKFHVGDGVHLSEYGNTVLINQLKKAIETHALHISKSGP